MTKKHFIAAAAIVRDSDADVRQALAGAFIDLFGEFNPRFDRERFLVACGLV